MSEVVDRSAAVARNGEALLAGGFPGAGKSTICQDHLVRSRIADGAGYAIVDPDAFTGELLHELGPEPPPELAALGLDPSTIRPEDLAPLVHRESLLVTQLAIDALRHRRTNVVVGTTLSSYGRGHRYLQTLAGYLVNVLIVDVDAGQAKRNLFHRWKAQRLVAEGAAGRFVPEAAVDRQADEGRTRALDVAGRLVGDGLVAAVEIWTNTQDQAGRWETRPVRWIPEAGSRPPSGAA